MTDITHEDLVKLAEYAGKENIRVRDDGSVWVDKRTPQGIYRVKWQPHRPEGAVQRDEVEDAVIAKGYQFKHFASSKGCSTTIMGLSPNSQSRYRQALGKARWCKTRGEAVCLAALQVIGETDEH